MEPLYGIFSGVLLAGLAWLAWHWRQTTEGAVDSEPTLSAEQLALLRQVGEMVLSGLSLPYIAQEVVNLIARAKGVVGATVWLADRTGSLTAIAVSDTLRTAEHAGLRSLLGAVVDSNQLAHQQSKLAQVLNERKVISGAQVRDFDSPAVAEALIDRSQRDLGIRGLVCYPMVVRDGVMGAVTFYLARPAKRLDTATSELLRSVTDEVGVAAANAKLMQQVDDVNQKLVNVNRHLQEVDNLKGEFIAVASHQLRSPLTVLKGQLSMLLEGDYGKLSQKQTSVVRQSLLSTNQLVNNVNDILSVSRIEAGQLDLNQVPTQLEDVVRAVVTELRPLAREKHLHLTVRLPRRRLPELQLDPLRIRHVVTNFLDNAIKYTQEGSVTVAIKRAGSDVVFEVTDTGIGVPESERAEMFSKYYRASNAKHFIVKGTGLGLFVARQTISDHHGEIIFTSQEGKGSTFGFRLPLGVVAVNAHPVRRPAAHSA